MPDPPAQQQQKGKATYGKQKQNLTLFGRWIEVLNRACQTNQAEVSARADMQKSILSKVTRGQSEIRRVTVLKLLHVYETLVTERHAQLPKKWQYLFFLAWSGDESLIREASEMVEHLEKIYDP